MVTAEGAKVFGVEHIVYLVISLILTIAGLVLIKLFCKSEKAKFIAIKVTGGVLLLSIILNRVACLLQWGGVHQLFPHSFCGLCSLVFSLVMLLAKRNSSPYHFITYSALIGGLLTTFYPTYITTNGPTFFMFSTITSLICHSLLIFASLLVFLLGYTIPNIKKWWTWPLGYFGFIAYGLFAIQILGKGDCMNINNPLITIAGLPLNWFYLGLLMIAVYTVFLIIWDICRNRSNCIWCECYRKIAGMFRKKKDN